MRARVLLNLSNNRNLSASSEKRKFNMKFHKRFFKVTTFSPSRIFREEFKRIRFIILSKSSLARKLKRRNPGNWPSVCPVHSFHINYSKKTIVSWLDLCNPSNFPLPPWCVCFDHQDNVSFVYIPFSFVSLFPWTDADKIFLHPAFPNVAN